MDTSADGMPFGDIDNMHIQHTRNLANQVALELAAYTCKHKIAEEKLIFIAANSLRPRAYSRDPSGWNLFQRHLAGKGDTHQHIEERRPETTSSGKRAPGKEMQEAVAYASE